MNPLPRLPRGQEVKNSEKMWAGFKYSYGSPSSSQDILLTVPDITGLIFKSHVLRFLIVLFTR